MRDRMSMPDIPQITPARTRRSPRRLLCRTCGRLVLISQGWRHVDYAQIDKCAVEAPFPFRGRCEVVSAAMLKQARARGIDLIKRQTSLLQSHCSEKGNIQVRAAPGRKSLRAVIQSFYGIERTELAPRVYG